MMVNCVGSRACWVLAVAGAIGLWPISSMRGDDRPVAVADRPAEPAAPTPKAEARKAKAGGKAKKGGAGKAAAKKAEAKAARIPLPHRPERTVKPPTLTPADLDRMLDEYLAKNDPKVEPAPLTSDVEFVRRLYFDLCGVPPTPDQVRGFVTDRSPEKRSKLIDTLLQSPDSARNWARYWRDVIRFHATNQNPAQVRYDLMEDWLAEQFGKNTPWDRIAHELMTATGRVDENGAVSFTLAHQAKPVELAGEVSRIFLGVQIQCAQCHDHKTDAWKREQFHEFAAFFSGTRSRRVMAPGPGRLPVFSVAAQGRPRYTMPDLNDPKKQIPVAPRFFLASSKAEPALPENLATDLRRELGADYVIGQDNPWFARAFVNRMWFVLLGESFYDAVDDLGPEREPRARRVIETLAEQWQQGGYDVRWLLRTITGTKAYQRRVRSTANPAGKTPFASNCPGRLRSDQILEELVQALGLPADLAAVPKNARGAGKAAASGKGAKLAAANSKKAVAAAGLASVPGAPGKQNQVLRVRGPRVRFNALFGTDPSMPNEDVLGTIPQALFLMNSPMVDNRTQARPGTVLGRLLRDAPDDRAALDRLYVRVLSRRPNEQELKTCAKYMSQVGNRVEAFEDIYWALINSTEFISRR
jgi:hypothetical protein